MRIEVTIDGKTYKSKPADDVTQANLAEQLYNAFEDWKKMKVDLEDGGILLMGINAVQRAQIVVYP